VATDTQITADKPFKGVFCKIDCKRSANKSNHQIQNPLLSVTETGHVTIYFSVSREKCRSAAPRTEKSDKPAATFFSASGAVL
jgi:hypothetical protein